MQRSARLCPTTSARRISISALAVLLVCIQPLPAHARSPHPPPAEMLRGAIAANRMTPMSMTVGDFDRDGIADVACGYAGPEGAAVAVHRGNPDLVYPNAPAARRRRAAGVRVASPLIPATVVAVAPETPDLLAAADFDADGCLDLALARRGEGSVFLMRGDGTGALASDRVLTVPGRIVAMAAGDLGARDGLPSLAVRTDSADLLLDRRAIVAHELSNAGFVRAGDPGVAASLDGLFARTACDAGGSVAEAFARLNADAVPDRVVLMPNASLPAVEASVAKRNFAVTSTDDEGPETLRAAIEAANEFNELFNITFAIPGSGPHTIALTAPLPVVTAPVSIDATTQAGFDGAPVVVVDGSEASNDGLVLAGGTSLVRGLSIVNFEGNGIVLRGSGGHIVEGCYVGLDARGGAAGNGLSGVWVDNVPANTIGGLPIDARNVVSDNDDIGVMIAGTGAAGNLVAGNRIGTNAAGTAAHGNGFEGILVSEAMGNLIGGNGQGNLISGNVDGIAIVGEGARGNFVAGNLIGTDATGTAEIGNDEVGLLISNSSGNVVGGIAAGLRNVVSANTEGIVILGAAATGNVVLGNFAGTNATGTAALPNSGIGLQIDGAVGTLVGGPEAGAGNLFSGNGEEGVLIQGPAATANVVRGNRIGTDVTGQQALSNDLVGLLVLEAPGNTIGGPAPGDGNLISGNGFEGLLIEGPQATGNIIQGNRIGPAADGTAPIGNGFGGITIAGGASSNRIGGPDAAEGNRIAFNRGDGVLVETGNGNAITGNAIFENGGLGISLGGRAVTPNDPGDTDEGANRLQNFPILAEATSANGVTAIAGRLESGTDAAYRIEFFANDTCDDYGFGEGQSYLGAAMVMATDAARVDFAVELPVAVAAGRFVTATATDADGNTSEFSSCVTVDLSWMPPDFDSGDELPPPRNLTVRLAEGVAVKAPRPPGDADGETPAGKRATLLGYNVYRSAQSGQAPAAANLFTSVPPAQTTVTATTEPGGSFFVVTAVYDTGESGPSNEAGAGDPPVVDTLKVKKSKIVAQGSNFDTGLLVIVDGIPFVTLAKIKKQGRKAVQKGQLASGQTLAEYLATVPRKPDGSTRVLIGFRNATGGVATVAYDPGGP